MSKAVLLSIQPKWCEFIASGKKTVEVRKTRPNLETPFKVYIYCTHSKNGNAYCKGNNILNGKVIGEFVCDDIDDYTNYSLDEQHGHIKRREDLLRSACMTLKDWRDYIGTYRSDFGYTWHISNLIIYDEPKELSEFRLYNMRAYYDEELKLPMPTHEITRPPQSWFYVEEKEGADNA